MPRIQERFLDAVVYLYPTIQAAASGEAAGGTGFIAARETARGSDRGLSFVVTNSHVVREGRSPVVRINRVNDKADIVALNANDWFHHPDGDDIAAAPIDLLDVHRVASIPIHLFLAEEHVEEYGFGPGDECFFAGRFVNRDGIEQNFPTLRFGNLARMPVEPVKHPTRGINQESFLVEARSLSGFSGSPVWIYQTAIITAEDTRMRSWDHSPVFLLGLDWSHLSIYKPVLGPDRKTPVAEGMWVELNSGMMGVVPAWKIAELLLGEDATRLMEEWLEEVRAAALVKVTETAEAAVYRKPD